MNFKLIVIISALFSPYLVGMQPQGKCTECNQRSQLLHVPSKEDWAKFKEKHPQEYALYQAIEDNTVFDFPELFEILPPLSTQKTCVQQLLDQKANVNCTTPDKNPPLMHAIIYGRTHLYPVLIEHGASLYHEHPHLNLKVPMWGEAFAREKYLSAQVLLDAHIQLYRKSIITLLGILKRRPFMKDIYFSAKTLLFPHRLVDMAIQEPSTHTRCQCPGTTVLANAVFANRPEGVAWVLSRCNNNILDPHERTKLLKYAIERKQSLAAETVKYTWPSWPHDEVAKWDKIITCLSREPFCE